MARFLRLTPDDLAAARAAALEVAPTPGRAEAASDLLPRLVALEGGSVWRGGWSLPTTLAELGRRVGVAAESLRRRLAILRRAGLVEVERLGRRGIRVALTLLRGVGAAPAPRPDAPRPQAPKPAPSPPVRREPDPAGGAAQKLGTPPRPPQDPLGAYVPGQGGCGTGASAPPPADAATLARAVDQRQREHEAPLPGGRARAPLVNVRAWRAAVGRALLADPEQLAAVLARADRAAGEAERARKAREAREAETARARAAAESSSAALERDRAERAAAWAAYRALPADERARVDAEAWARVPDPSSPVAKARHEAAVVAVLLAQRAP